MKKITVGCLTILLCTAASLRTQQIADVPTFKPDQPTGVPQNVSSDARETAEQANIDTKANLITDFWKDGVSCGSGTGFVAKKGKVEKPLAVDSLPTGCQLLFNEANAYDNDLIWQMDYDTSMKLVVQCANSNFPDVISGFQFMSNAADGLGNYGAVRSNYYAWLKSVLYLNTTTPEYFCACVEAIAGETPVPNHIYPDTGYDWNLAIINWLIQNTNCDSSFLRRDFANGRQSQISTWENNPSSYKLDTTLPPLDSIDPGLNALLNKHFLYASVSESQGLGILSNATANPNPVNEGTVISFSISKEAYVKIELFDVLGKQASSYGYESLFEPGNKSVSFSLAGLPSGTYYARIITAYGVVQTVKLVKE